MARTKRKGDSLGAYFRKVFAEHPEWVKSKSNKLMKARYEHDHPGKEWTPRVRGNMANIKSKLRKLGRKRGPKSGKGVARTALNSRIQSPEGLELAIDHCLSNARQMNAKGMEDVIRYLRAARNALVYQMGEP